MMKPIVLIHLILLVLAKADWKDGYDCASGSGYEYLSNLVFEDECIVDPSVLLENQACSAVGGLPVVALSDTVTGINSKTLGCCPKPILPINLFDSTCSTVATGPTGCCAANSNDCRDGGLAIVSSEESSFCCFPTAGIVDAPSLDAPAVGFENFKVYSNPLDGRLLSFSVNDINAIFYGPFGKELDIPFSLELMSSDGNITVLTMEEYGSLKEVTVTASTGEIASFNFDNLPSVVEPITDILVNVNLPFDNFDETFAVPRTTNANQEPTNNRALLNPGNRLEEEKVGSLKVSTVESDGYRNTQVLQRAAATLDVQLQHYCKQANPDNPSEPFQEFVTPTDSFRKLSATVIDPLTGVQVRLQPERITVGSYRFVVPVESTNVVVDNFVDSYCVGVDTFFSITCPWIRELGPNGGIGMCSSLAEAIGRAIDDERTRVRVLVQCYNAFEAGYEICTSGEPTPPISSTPFAEVCRSLAKLDIAIQDFYFPNEVEMTVELVSKDGKRERVQRTWTPAQDDPSGPPVLFDIDDPIKIIRVDIEWGGGGYMVQPVVTCVTEFTSIGVGVWLGPSKICTGNPDCAMPLEFDIERRGFCDTVGVEVSTPLGIMDSEELTVCQ